MTPGPFLGDPGLILAIFGLILAILGRILAILGLILAILGLVLGGGVTGTRVFLSRPKSIHFGREINSPCPGDPAGHFESHLGHLGPHLGDRGLHFGHLGPRLRRIRQDVAKKCQGPPEFGLRGCLLKKYIALNGGVDVFFVGVGLSLQSHLYSVSDSSMVALTDSMG